MSPSLFVLLWVVATFLSAFWRSGRRGGCIVPLLVWCIGLALWGIIFQY